MNNPDRETPEPYHLRFEHREGYLYAFVEGENDSYEISIAFWRDIWDELQTTDYRKLLVEENLVEVVSMNDMYRIACELPVMGFSAYCVAFVDRFLTHRDINEFGEMVASNRGGFCKIFDNFDEGEAWLLAQ